MPFPIFHLKLTRRFLFLDQRMLCAFVLALCSLVAPALKANEGSNAPILVAYNERPPYLMVKEGKITGIIGQRTSDAFASAGVEHIWRGYPSNRQMFLVRQNQEAICAPGWFKNPERLEFAQFTIALYQDRPSVIITRQDNQIVFTHRTLASLVSDRQLVLLINDGFSYGPYMDSLIDPMRSRTIETTRSNLDMARMIEFHRADYMIAAYEEALTVVPFEANLAYHKLSDIPAGNERHIICSKKVPHATITRLNQAIQAQKTIAVEMSVQSKL